MAKILLVEDDNNLREIYEARLQAEGYTIVSAMDGEAALVLAKKEKPDLVISDVMMPRISGFEMLDILRNTEGLKEVKVIMLTALGQAEDKTRADSLGADRYLVKSQVTLEDIVKAAQELLGPDTTPIAGGPQVTAAAAEQAAAMATAPIVTASSVAAPTTPTAPSAPAAQPSATTPPVQAAPATVPAIPVVEPNTASTPAAPAAPAPSSTPVAATTPTPATTPETPEQQPPTGIPTPASPPVPPTTTATTPTPTPAMPASPAPAISAAPIEPSAPVGRSSVNPAQAQSSSEEEAAIKAQIEEFVNKATATAPRPATPAPAPTPTTVPTPPSNPNPAVQEIIQPTPATASESAMADAIKDLVSDTGSPAAPAPATPKVIAPPTSTPAPTPPANQTTPDDDNVTVAHKKVISPISNPEAVQPMGLDELLAKEGMSSAFDDETGHPFGPMPAQQNTTNANPALPAQPVVPSGLPSTPHPPGHVISPNSGSGVDPNSIAL